MIADRDVIQREMTTDVHTHVVFADLGHVNDPLWPVFHDEGGDLHLRLSTGRRRVVPKTSVDMTARLQDMDQRGIGRHVLSPMPAQLADVIEDGDVAVVTARAVNQALAGYVAVDPDRLSGLGTMPVVNGPAMRDELLRCMDAPGLLGFELSSEGFFRLVEQGLWTAAYDVLCEANAWLLVHPQDDALERRRNVSGRLAIGGVSMLNETALVAVEMMRLGTYGPGGARVILSHGGGTLPYLLARLDRLWEATDARADLPDEPSSVFRSSFYIDTCVHDSQALALAASKVDAGRVMFGSDYPFAIGVPPSMLDDAGIDRVENLLWANAQACGIEPWRSPHVGDLAHTTEREELA